MPVASVQASEVSGVLDSHGRDAKVLSLDCFDTLIWRNTHQPADVFADIRFEGVSPATRIAAERRSRLRNRMAGLDPEVSIEEIHSQINPDHEKARCAVNEELDAEIRHCFAFRPTVDLIRRAKERKLTVIIVSDTYFDESQLRKLIGCVAGAEVLSMIDRIFCSREYGVPKAAGLFKHVLKALKCRADTVLHVGDNKIADHDAPMQLGIRGLHMRQFDDRLQRQLRLESVASTLLDPEIGHTRPALQPHRAPLSAFWPASGVPSERFGFGVLGPLMHGFCKWLLDEAAQIERDYGKTPRLAFLMRDGHLPELAFRSLPGADRYPVARVEISRFTARAASMRSRQDVVDVLSNFATQKNLHPVGNQLLLTPEETVKIVSRASKAPTPIHAFAEEVLKSKILRQVLDRSQGFADRLTKHFLQQVAPIEGDIVLFVDLGYSGSVQTAIAPVLEERLGIKVLGRYLLSLETPGWHQDRKGFLGPDLFDNRALRFLTSYIAILEQFSTISMGSVIRYTAEGEPIRGDSSSDDVQNAIRSAAQEACLDYIARATQAFHSPPRSLTTECYRQAAAGTLARLLLVPSEEEVSLFARLEHEVNMGTRSKIMLFDKASAERDLKRRGVFYVNRTERQFATAELSSVDLAIPFMLAVQKRFGLDLNGSDFHRKKISLPIMVAGEQGLSTAEINAFPTHEGYFVAAIPIGRRQFTVGVQFGKLFEWIQLEGVETISSADFASAVGQTNAVDVTASVLVEGMEAHTNGLYRCLNESSFMLIPPPETAKLPPAAVERSENFLLTVIFRPLAARPGVQIHAGTAEREERTEVV